MPSTQAAVPAVEIAVRDRYLRLTADGWAGDFHLRWLRHNCDRDRHPVTGERVVDSSQLPDELAVAGAAIAGDALEITWAHDRRVSSYPLPWLERHAYARDRVEVPPPPADVALLELDARAPLPAVIDAALVRVRERGAVVLRAHGAAATASPDHTEALLEAFDDGGLRVIATHFGRIEDLRTDNTTNANTDQLGYTDAGIDLHTDQPFLDAPPRYQLLHAIRAADEGGLSLIADARAAFRYLEATDRPAAELLRRTPVVFHRQQRAFERVVTAPLVVDEPDRFAIRSSYFTLAPFRLPFDEVEAWYRAYDRFGRLVHDPRHHYRFLLAPGDVLFYDNHRVLHGRTGFVGPRWIRGVYFDPPSA